jgi:hypothetical protein
MTSSAALGFVAVGGDEATFAESAEHVLVGHEKLKRITFLGFPETTNQLPKPSFPMGEVGFLLQFFFFFFNK